MMSFSPILKTEKAVKGREKTNKNNKKLLIFLSDIFLKNIFTLNLFFPPNPCIPSLKAK